jgi:WD40 repeat protein
MVLLRGCPLLTLGLALALGPFAWGARCHASEPLRLRGHDAQITAVCFAPDGKTVASAGTDGTILLRDAVPGKQAVAPEGHKGGVYGVAFSPDGKTLASAGADGLVRLWEAATGRELQRLAGHQGKVAAVAFSPDGKVVASGGYDGTLRLWDPATGQETRRLDGPKGRVTALAFSPDGKWLASGGTVQERISDARKNLLITGQADAITLWDLAGEGKARRLSGRGSSILFSPDGRTVAGGGLVADSGQAGDGTTIDGLDLICLIDAVSGETLRQIKWRGRAVAFSPDGKALASGGGSLVHLSGFGVVGPNGVNARNTDYRVRLWDAKSAKEILRFPQKDATALAFSPDGKTLAVGDYAGTVTLWDIEAERRNPTPDPAEVLHPPPPGDKLLAGLDADFQELLKEEKDPQPLREAHRLFDQTNQSDRWTAYLDALALVRQHRSRAAVPLLLQYMVQHASFGSFDSRAYVDTLVILTGEDIADPYRYVADRQKPVRDAVHKLVETWWRPNRERLTTDLARMSPEQLQVIVGRLVGPVRGEPGEEPYADPAERADRILSSALGRREASRRRWWDEDLHPAMVPLLLAPAGFEEKPAAKPAGRENYPIPYAAVPLLAALRRNGAAPPLDRIAADTGQNSATRLTCLLALYGAGEELRTGSVLPILESEKKLERRIVAILALGYCRDAREASQPLIKLLEDPNVYVRGAAVRALHAAKPPEALPQLRQLLEDGDAREAVLPTLSLVAAIGTAEAREVLARFLARALEEGPRSGHLLPALHIFEQATGHDWTEAGAHPDGYYREAARKALEWWKSEKR